jgi:hypothetical protein
MIKLSLLYFNLLILVDKKKYKINYNYNDEIKIIPLFTIIGQGTEKIKYFIIHYNNVNIRLDVYGVWHSKKNKDSSYYYETKNFYDIVKIINNDFFY